MDILKPCTKCLQELPVDSFRKQQGTKDGLQYECKICTNARAKERYEEKSREIIEKNSTWQKKNKEIHAAAARKYNKSPTGKISRTLNRRLDILLGKNRESFLHLIGLTPSVLLVYLGRHLPEGACLEDYGKKWVVSFVKQPSQENLDSEECARKFLNWKNLIPAKKEKNPKTIDLATSKV